MTQRIGAPEPLPEKMRDVPAAVPVEEAAIVSAWAVVEGGEINVRSISDTMTAAKISFLCTDRGMLATIFANDGIIERAWNEHRRGAVCQRVTVTTDPAKGDS